MIINVKTIKNNQSFIEDLFQGLKEVKVQVILEGLVN